MVLTAAGREVVGNLDPALSLKVGLAYHTVQAELDRAMVEQV